MAVRYETIHDAADATAQRRKLFLKLGAAAAALVVGTTLYFTRFRSADIAWAPSFQKGWISAKREGKPVLTFFRTESTAVG